MWWKYISRWNSRKYGKFRYITWKSLYKTQKIKIQKTNYTKDKFTKDKIGKKVITEEEEQIKNLDINFYKLGFVSKNGFKNDFDKEKYNLFTLKDFYKDWSLKN